MIRLGLCVTLGRPCLPELQALWAAQTHAAPLIVVRAQARTLGETRHRALRGLLDGRQLGPRDWVVVVDDDDYLHPGHLGALSAAIRHRPRAAFATSQHFGFAAGAHAPIVRMRTPAVPRMHGAGALNMAAYLATPGYPSLQEGEDTALLRTLAGVGGFAFAEPVTFVCRRDRTHHGGTGTSWSPDALQAWCEAANVCTSCIASLRK